MRRQVAEKHRSKRIGSGLVNSFINKLPFELHIPSYNFCGPGTHLKKRLVRGDKGVNLLDEACKQHDISYSQFQDIENRHKADKLLLQTALQRLRAKDSSIGEKAASLLVSGAMKGKTALGMGVRRRRKRTVTKKLGRSSLMQKRKYRIIKPPKVGGFIFSIPLLLGALGALGSVGGAVAGITKTVNDAKAANRTLEETQRHNKTMEQLAAGKGIYLPYKKKIRGSGLYLQSYKKGLGLYLNPKNFR